MPADPTPAEQGRARVARLDALVGTVEDIRKRVYGTTPLTDEVAAEQNRKRVLLAEIDRLRIALAEQREREQAETVEACAALIERARCREWTPGECANQIRQHLKDGRLFPAAIRRGDAS